MCPKSGFFTGWGGSHQAVLQFKQFQLVDSMLFDHVGYAVFFSGQNIFRAKMNQTPFEKLAHMPLTVTDSIDILYLNITCDHRHTCKEHVT